MLLMTMDSKELLKSSKEPKIKKVLATSLVVVASDGLEVTGEHPNVTHIPQIVPPAVISQKHMAGDIAGFNRMYLKYLQSPQLTVILSSLLTNAANEGKNIVFLCNTVEEGFGYLEILGNYLHAAFGIESAPFKKVAKGKTSSYEADSEDIVNKCEERFARAEELSPNVIQEVQQMFESSDKKKKKKKKKK